MEPAAQIPLLMSSGSTSHCSPDLRVATMARTVELTASGSPRNVRASTRCKNPLRTAGESVTSWTPARAPGVIPQSPHTLPSPRGRPWALVLKPLFPETMHADTTGPPWEQDPQHSGRARESRLTVADPAPRRALSSEQSELGLQGTRKRPCWSARLLSLDQPWVGQTAGWGPGHSALRTRQPASPSDELQATSLTFEINSRLFQGNKKMRICLFPSFCWLSHEACVF